MASGLFTPQIDCSKSVHSNAYIDYFLFFHPLPNPTWLAEVVNVACVEQSNF